MRVLVPKKSLADALARVERIVPSRSSNPGLSLMRIDVRDDAVWIRGRHATVSLTLDARDNVKLRSALALLSSKTDDLPDLNTDTPAPVARAP